MGKSPGRGGTHKTSIHCVLPSLMLALCVSTQGTLHSHSIQPSPVLFPTPILSPTLWPIHSINMIDITTNSSSLLSVCFLTGLGDPGGPWYKQSLLASL